MTRAENGALKQKETAPYEDEINLMDYIQIIIKRKKLILSLFFIVIIFTTITGFLSPRVYKAEASIMIMPSKIQSPLSPTQISLNPEKTERGEYALVQKPAISILTHRTLLKSSAVVQRVMNKLILTGLLDKDTKIEALFGKLAIEEIKNAEQTNILQLSAKDKKPGLARDIVNIWAEEYAQYSLGIITGEVQGSGDFVVKQFELSKGELVKAEQAVTDFDVKERLSLMEIELKENTSQLNSHYANIQKLDFTLKEKEYLLKKTTEDIAALTKNGLWIGSFNVKEAEENHFTDTTLTNEQKTLRQHALTAKLDLENNNKTYDEFVNNSRILLLKAEVERKRTDLVEDKTRLAQVRQYGESTKANLNSKANLDTLKELRGPIAENLPELTIWEILSLTGKYNFFETSGQSLASKIEQQGQDLHEQENVLFGYNSVLKTLRENLDRTQAIYDFYYSQFKTIQNQKISLETEITKLEFELSYSRQMVEKLEGPVKTLKAAINERQSKLTELNRQLDISSKAYTTLASKLEDARIAKAMEMGDVKVVSTAFEPQNPVATKQKLRVAIAGVASLMLGVFIAFCLEFWQKYEVLKKSQTQAT